MVDDKKTAPPELKAEPKVAAVKLAPAGESGDPAVHQLLAELETARSNGDDAGVTAAKTALADLGVGAG